MNKNEGLETMAPTLPISNENIHFPPLPTNFGDRFRGIKSLCMPDEADYDQCVDIKFIGHDNQVYEAKARLEENYIVDPTTGFLVHSEPTGPPLYQQYPTFPVPSGYTLNELSDLYLHWFRKNQQKLQSPADEQVPTYPSIDPTKNNEIPLDYNKKYDNDNLDAVYHSDPQIDADAKSNLVGYKIMQDSRGNNVEVPYAELNGQTLYNSPGSMKFGPSSYVPNYEETVYLSQLTNETPFKELKAEDKIGFCKQNAQSPEILEQKCNALSGDVCSSTDCCVNFGGAKCVAGDQNGPLLRNNYGDLMVKNRDFYYYKGKCYGNCERSSSILNSGLNIGSSDSQIRFANESEKQNYMAMLSNLTNFLSSLNQSAAEYRTPNPTQSINTTLPTTNMPIPTFDTYSQNPTTLPASYSTAYPTDNVNVNGNEPETTFVPTPTL